MNPDPCTLGAVLNRGLTREEMEEDRELLQQDWEVASVLDFLQVLVIPPGRSGSMARQNLRAQGSRQRLEEPEAFVREGRK